jgi:hypothetical protein
MHLDSSGYIKIHRADLHVRSHVCVHVHTPCLKNSVQILCTSKPNAKKCMCAGIYFFIRRIITLHEQHNRGGVLWNKIMYMQ